MAELLRAHLEAAASGPGGHLLALALGLAAGSFAGMCAWRLPEGEPLAWQRSKCPGCKKKIPLHRNLPLISYALARGRCFACRERIHWRYPAAEGACGLLIWGAFAQFGPSPAALAAGGFCMLLALLSIIDAEHLVLPDELTLGLLWCGLVFSLTGTAGGPFPSPAQAIAGAAAGYLALWALNGLWRWTRKRKRDVIGQGDWKMLAALGAWLGPAGLCGALAAASIAGALWAAAAQSARRSPPPEKRPLPFGPFLAFGGAWAMLDPGGLHAAFLRTPLEQILGLTP